VLCKCDYVEQYVLESSCTYEVKLQERMKRVVLDSVYKNR
jgi:hypothetical protein